MVRGSDAKTALRARMRVVRQAIEPDARARRSARLWEHVLARPEYGAARVVMAFCSLPAEPDTADLLERCWTDGKQVVVPRVEGRDLVPVPLGPDTPVVVSSFGVREPEGPGVDPRTIDLVVTPGLAFTADGWRLGYGAGFYDRFLDRLRPDAVTVGVGFAEQVVDDVPHDEHDRRVDLVVTDAGVAGAADAAGAADGQGFS
jgi:5-formyltetrahydrofolate cyclo-ligase